MLNIHRTALAAGSALLVMLFALPAMGEQPLAIPHDGTAEAMPPTARVSFLDGTLYGWGPFEDEKRHLILNDIVREGDELYAAPGTFAEIELPGNNFVRLGGGSSVTIVSYQDDIQIIPTAGSVYVSTGSWNQVFARFGEDQAEVASYSLARLDIQPEGERQLGVAAGLASIHGATAFKIAENQRVFSSQPGVPWVYGEFYPRNGDDFDLWNLQREGLIRRPLDDDVPSYPLVGYHELQDYGAWLVVDGVWGWHPHVETSWRPFSVGEWVWNHGYGWVWVSGTPWGWVTGHYGRWMFSDQVGWVWMPGMVWAPAWVAWSSHGGYIGWCPIDWWGRPVVLAGWYSYYYWDYWIFCNHDYFYHGGYHHHGSYHYSDYHGNSHRRYTSRDGHGGQGAGYHGVGHDGDQGGGHGAGGASNPSNERDTTRSHAFGGDFQQFTRDEFDAMERTPIRGPNQDLLRAASATPEQRQAFEAGGATRTAMLRERCDSCRNSARDRGTPLRANGYSGGGGSTPTRSYGSSGDGTLAGDRAREALGVGGEHQMPDRSAGEGAPYTPRYDGRSDGNKGYDRVRDYESRQPSSSSSSSDRPTRTYDNGGSSSSGRSSSSSSRSSSSSGRSSSSKSSSSKSSSSKSSSSKSSSSKSSSSKSSSGSSSGKSKKK